MRLSPCCWIVGSRVPISSMRLRITSVATSIALLTALSMPASVGVMTMVELLTTSTLKSRWPVRPAPWVSGRIRSTAASTWAGSRTMKLSFPSRLEISPIAMRGSPRRNSVRTCSSILTSRCLATSWVDASSSKWLPPARSSPRLTRVCMKPGSFATAASGRKLGTAHSTPIRSGRRIAAIAQREKFSMTPLSRSRAWRSSDR